ncbi:MAG: hypothetical protein KJ791_02855, partial [Nanoarchaeota archaeon]|nr:hypothetical protein [Nanoarchaeota archaeon]
MKKSVLFLALMVLLIQSTLAFKTLEIEDEPIENVLIGSKEATFWVNLTNNGDFKDIFRISTLDIQWDIEPKQVTVNARSSNIFKFTITPFTEREPALYGVSVKFISDNDESIKDSHLFKIDVLSYENMISPTFVLPKEINSNKENLFSLNLLNDHNIHLEDIKVVLESDFFSYERELEFLPYEEIKEDFLVSFDGSIEEGQYPIKVKIFYQDEFAKEVITNMNIGYFPDVTEVRTPESSFLVERTTIVKVNEGNLISHESYEKDFTWFEKLFTYTDPKPTSIEKDGKYTYTWEFDLDSGEEVIIFIQTNYR